jgi:hypothetical protein
MSHPKITYTSTEPIAVELSDQVVAEVAERVRHADQVDRGAVRDRLHDHVELRARFVDESGRSAVDQVLERADRA